MAEARHSPAVLARQEEHSGGVRAGIHRVAGDVILLVADLPAGGSLPVRPAPTVGGRPAPRPFSVLALPTTAGGTRVIAALRLPQSAGVAPVALQDGDGRTLAWAPTPTLAPTPGPAMGDPPADGDDVSPAADRAGFGDRADALLKGLAPVEQARVVRLMLEFCSGTYGCGADPAFADQCRRLMTALVAEPAPLTAVAEVRPGLLLCRGTLPAGFGDVLSVVVLGGRRVSRTGQRPLSDPAPDRRGRRGLSLLLDDAGAGAGGGGGGGDPAVLVVLIGARGLACRALRREAGGPSSVHAVLETKPGRLPAPVRAHLSAALTERMERDPGAALVLAEIEALHPLPAVAITARDRPFGARIDLSVQVPGAAGGGLFVAGWLQDPSALVQGIDAIGPAGGFHPLAPVWHRFPREDVARHYDLTDATTAGQRQGFVAFLPRPAAPLPAGQQRFALVLGSGARIDLLAPPAPRDPAVARNAVLGSLPPRYLSPAALAQAIAPAAEALHAAWLAARRPPEEVAFGDGDRTAVPPVSIVVPLYRVLDFLRVQLAAFAVDPTLAAAEIVYVLDSPEQRLEVEHLLTGLVALYGRPVRLVVMDANHGFAAACNAGAAASRGETILFLNSDVIPDGPGWITPLLACLDEHPGTGAVGPKLLFADDSLQHAGLYFGRDLRGEWINLHYYKGLPRDFAPACCPRPVPAVTGAAVLVRRAVFAAVDGFTESYIIGDYEDSDLCLKIRRLGADIRYVPAAELYHLERQSIVHHAGYTRGVACEYNRWLHARRWGGWMERLCGAAASAALPEPAMDEGRD